MALLAERFVAPVAIDGRFARARFFGRIFATSSSTRTRFFFFDRFLAFSFGTATIEGADGGGADGGGADGGEGGRGGDGAGGSGGGSGDGNEEAVPEGTTGGTEGAEDVDTGAGEGVDFFARF